MRNNTWFLKHLVSYVKSIGILILISLLIFYLLYGFEYSSAHISNAIFIPNIIVFIISIGINVGAGNIFSPVNYTVLKFFNRKKAKELYQDYADYIDQKKKEVKNYWFLTIATITLLIVAYGFASF